MRDRNGYNQWTHNSSRNLVMFSGYRIRVYRPCLSHNILVLPRGARLVHYTKSQQFRVSPRVGFLETPISSALSALGAVLEKNEEVPSEGTDFAWMRRHLSDSIYLWACGEKADNEGDAPRLSDRLLGWLILFVSGIDATLVTKSMVARSCSRLTVVTTVV